MRKLILPFGPFFAATLCVAVLYGLQFFGHWIFYRRLAIAYEGSCTPVRLVKMSDSDGSHVRIALEVEYNGQKATLSEPDAILSFEADRSASLMISVTKTGDASWIAQPEAKAEK